jgi:lysophospholipase L1-like esterase
VTPVSGSSPDTLTVSVDATGLARGTYSATITATAGGYADDTVGVVLTVTFGGLPIVETFNDGDAGGWIPYDDSGKGFDWQVINSSYQQINPFSGSTFAESYHLGKYSLLDYAGSLTDYRVSLEITPLDEGGNDVGIMFRYQDNDNYYRLSFNSRYGFTRLEKKYNGVFSPLKTNSRGYIIGQTFEVIVEIKGNLILVYLNDDPLFSIIDSSISSGTIALYCQGEAIFDNIQIDDNSSQTEAVISSPVAYSVVASELGVVSEENGLVSIEAEHYFNNISQGGHTWIEVYPTGYSGTAAMEASPNVVTNNNTGYIANSPRLDFKVGFIRSGTYYIWVRGIGATGEDDSLHIGLNGNEVVTSDRITGFGTNWTWSNETMDGPAASIEIPSDGVHMINVWMREDGFIIDKVVLSIDPNCSVCTGIEPAESPVNADDSLSVMALATNLPSGESVEFELDGIACEPSFQSSQGVLISKCLDIFQGESILDIILSASGSILDTNEQIGIFGNNLIAAGDSIFNGSVDNFKSDNNSQNGKIISIQGFEANLTDLLTNSTGLPTIVFNEAIPGDESYNAAYERIKSILLRHPNSSKVLLLLGINDSNANPPVPSGWDCFGSACAGTYMENMQRLIDIILGSGKEPVVALVTPSFGASNSGSTYPDPLTGDRNILIQQYNWVIAGDGTNPSMLTGHTVGPDFFYYFLGSGVNRFSLFADNVHPNALGMVVIAHLWNNFFTGGNTFPFTIEDLIPLNYKQNLLEEGDNYYTDRDYQLESIPSELIGDDIIWIMTANDDKDNNSDDFISFYLAESATVYIAFDPRATSLPNWLVNNFTPTGLILSVTNPQTSTLALYSANFAPGEVFLGGNKAEGTYFPVGVDAANYIVAIKKD